MRIKRGKITIEINETDGNQCYLYVSKFKVASFSPETFLDLYEAVKAQINYFHKKDSK